MSTRILLGIADQVLATDLTSRIEALEDYAIAHISESTQELVPAVLNHDPDVLILDRDLQPGPISRVTHDLTTRRPALPILLVSRVDREDSLSLALEVGARAVLTYPFVLAEVSDALQRAVEWGERMHGMLTDGGATPSTQGGIAALAGSKGGVGTSLVASHLAWMIIQERPTMSVCLVDLDLEKGDVPSYIDLAHRVSIVDLAKISEDITDRVVRDTVAVHESGLHILPAPTDVRDVDVVTPQAVRSILAQLRQMYDVVIVDTGSNVTPTQCAAVEMADHTLQLVTTDVPSLRAARRQTQFWSELGVRNPADVWVLVNKFSRDAEIQQSTIDRLVLGRRMETLVPDLGRSLEPAVNTRTPSHNTPKNWWKSLGAVVRESEILTALEEEPAQQGFRLAGIRRSGRGPRAGKGASPEAGGPQEPAAPEPVPARSRESGQAAIEAVGVLPITVIFIIIFWQILGLGISVLWAGEAANAAAREASLGGNSAEVADAARDVVPSVFHGAMTVSSGGDDVEVTIKMSPIGEGAADAPVNVDRDVTREPRP